MRVGRIASVALLAICVGLPAVNDAFAGDNAKATKKAREKTSTAPAPDPMGASAGVPQPDTITKTVNELGQTVYSIRPSHFDISPPLLEMARAAAANAPRIVAEEDDEPLSNPMLPDSRIIRSNVPDPVVQSVIPSADSLALGNVPLAIPTTGFNFAGVGRNASWPSDSNGSVGNNQFVETVNARYQVWSLNRATQVATPLLPSPANIKTLWSGFGGPCETQSNLENGDPIVLFDKTAKRWLISFVTATPPAGVYYECVTVSTGADATGTYARYAFAVPNGNLGDYPHYGVWPPAAYFMMGFAYQSSAGGYVAAIFAAMDRTKMLAANPTATLLVIEDPSEYGHMPADLDGFALPPALAPGIFVSLHDDGMYIYRLKVSFAGSGSAVKTLQAIVPVAPSGAACAGGSCIPQPGSGTRLNSLADRLMFRAAYRNFIDHESLVVSHSVDPSVDGVVSGVRWYDIRLSGNPDATCPTYPCVYQQGTIADVPGGRSRWIPSLAMDAAENILVGYNTTGQADGTDNHSSRYTGRAKADPPGVMTAPETVVVTGTANATFFSWGDYASMSVDPFDDCTFWYVSQYYDVTDQWSTRIASDAFPAGSGAGQCPPTTCVTRPAAVPTIGTATAPGDNQITVAWTGITPIPGAYAIERALGACGAEGLYRPLAATAGTASSFTDTTVQGGIRYSYRVRAAADAAGKCQALLTSGCVSATATGTCSLKPSFSGAAVAASAQQGSCGVTLSWTPGVSGCPLTPSLRYNIFRGTTPDFVPSIANRIATCVVGSSYLDTDNLQSGTTSYYVVRAEDSSTVNGGECAGGNEESNSVIVYGTPFGAGWQGAPGTWTDAGGDVRAALTLVSRSGPGWRFVESVNDPGANHTPGGSYAYRNAGPTASDRYDTLCSRMYTPPLTAGAASLNLQYWERHQLETRWDGVEIAYSVNGGPWTEVPAPSNSPAEGCDAADDTTDWNTLVCSTPASGSPDPNTCGIPPWKHVITGPFPLDDTCSTRSSTSPAANPYAHRCHPFTGLTPDDSIQFRWGSTADKDYEYAGFYLDDVAVTNVRLPNVCVPNTCPGQANGTGCDDGNACTINDACSSGSCAGTPITVPAETQHVRVEADKVSFVWDPQPSSTAYVAVRGALGAFPVGPGGGEEVCFGGLGAAGLVDASIPATDTGFWYLSRAQNACGVGTFGQQSSGVPRVTTTCP